MVRALLTTSLIALAAPVWAETFVVDAKVDTVTIYPGLATVSRLITLNLPAGQHEVVVPGLPWSVGPEGLRLSAPDTVRLGAVSLSDDRLPVTPDMTSPEVQAAMDEVERLEAVLRDRSAAIAEIRLRVAAADEQIAFLQSLSQASAGENLTDASIDTIQALARMVGSEVLAARQAGFAAEQEAKAAELARQDDIEALNQAKQALEALMAPEEDGSVLTFSVSAAAAGEVTIDVSTLEDYANWAPVYDMRLTTGNAPKLDLDRAVVVSQETGQDWLDVNLVLSTARPGEQVAPGQVWPQLRRIIPEEELGKSAIQPRSSSVSSMMMSDTMAPMIVEEAAEMSPAIVATADFSGATVTYRYPGRVDIRNGVDDLRLPLDTVSLEADVWAEAVPSRDTIAYRMAEFANDTQEVFLPGQAMLFADGTMIGFGALPLLAAGADTTMGFGPLDGLRLTRATPSRTEGDRGVFTTTNQLTERAVLTIENLTGQDWPVLVRDAVPITEQEDLELKLTASPAITRRDPEGQRGILEWDLDLARGAVQTIDLDYTLTWPSGYVLR